MSATTAILGEKLIASRAGLYDSPSCADKPAEPAEKTDSLLRATCKPSHAAVPIPVAEKQQYQTKSAAGSGR
jgi:hypothetical protein